MNAVELVKEFASNQGIEISEVNKFLAKYNAPQTLEDLAKLPSDMLKHMKYISDLDDPLYSFIKEEMYTERYMTIDLERITDVLLDRMYELEDKEKLKYYKSVEKHVIDIKFGSVVMDW